MDKKLLSFSVEEVKEESLEDINDSQFMKIRIRAFSDGVTRHGYSFTLDEIKESAFTILGKPILFKFDEWHDDCGSHDKGEVQCGFIPFEEEKANIQYEYDEDLDKTFLVVNAYIWKVYQENLFRILSRDDGYKKVSVEMWLVDYDDSENSNVVPVFSHCYTGITILGEHITEACTGANLEVTKFSYEDYKKAQNDFISQMNSINETQNRKEKEIPMKKNSKKVLKNDSQISTISVSVSQINDILDDDGNFKGTTDEYHTKSVTTRTEKKGEELMDGLNDVDVTLEDNANVDDTKEIPEDNACKTEEDNACLDKKEECADTTSDTSDDTTSDDTTSDTSEEDTKEEDTKEEDCAEDTEEDTEETNTKEVKEEDCAELKEQCNSLKKECEALKEKCAELQKFKDDTESANKTVEVECALNEVSSILPSNEIDEWRNKSTQYNSVDRFKNDLKAFAFDKARTLNCDFSQSMRNALPIDKSNDDLSTWEKLEKCI